MVQDHVCRTPCVAGIKCIFTELRSGLLGTHYFWLRLSVLPRLPIRSVWWKSGLLSYRHLVISYEIFKRLKKKKPCDSSTSCLLNPQQEGSLDPQFTSKHNSGHADRESAHNSSFNCQLKTFPSGSLTVILQIQSKLPHLLHLNTNADHQARGCPNLNRNRFVHPHMFSDISLKRQKETSLFLR